MSATDTAAADGEWCGPTRQLKNSQLLALQHKSRKIIIETLRVDVEVARDDEVVLLVNKPPECAAVIGSKIDALPEAVVLDPPKPASMMRTERGSGSMYPLHRDTLRPLRVMLVMLVIAAGVTVATLVV